MHGGGHGQGIRPATLPVPLIVGFAKAVELCLEDLDAESRRIGALRDRLRERLCSELPDVHENGHPVERLPGNLNVSFDGIDADQLLVALPGVALSTGSACASASAAPSHVLAALGLSEGRMRGAIRIGIGRGNTREEIDAVATRLVEAVRKARLARSTAGLHARQ
jgi:cysteine desulfurase